MSEEIKKVEEEIQQVQAKMKDPKLCAHTLDVQSRISGYYRSLNNWNPGKAQEFTERSEYKVA
jgi:anaerobic ribonucleoside-triphosphate reductase